MDSQIVLLDYDLDQATMDFSLRRFGRIRDYSNYSLIESGIPAFRIPFLSPYILIASYLSTAINSTLMAYKDMPPQTVSSLHEIQYPRVLPFILTKGAGNRTIPYFINLYRSKKYEGEDSPQFAQIPSLDINFVYCQIPKSKQVNLLSFSEFTENLDRYIWISLLLAFIGTTVVLGRSQWHTVLSVLLATSTNYAPSNYRKSTVFVLWMFCTILITFLYSASVTSKLIKPEEDDLLASIEDLQMKHFSLFVPSKIGFDELNNTYQKMNPARINRNVRILRDMIKHSQFWDGSETYFEKFLESSSSYATVYAWNIALKIANDINEIATTLRNRGKAIDKRCYVGQELITNGEFYFGFLPPKSNVLARKFKNLMEAGIYYRLNEEAMKITYSQRVQDRIKVKGPTEFIIDDPNKTIVLNIYGKVSKIFLLWLACTLISFLEFSWEVMHLLRLKLLYYIKTLIVALAHTLA